MSSYCDFAPGRPLHVPYHGLEYGFPIEDDDLLFERLILEINQAGLNRELMLKKRDGFRAAYAGFDVDVVAAFDEDDRARLLADAAIIRKRLKVNATIENARKIVAMRQDHGSFAGWLATHQPLTEANWVKLFRRTFRFTGGEIVGEFLISTGYLPGAHRESCPVYAEIMALAPPWLDTE